MEPIVSISVNLVLILRLLGAFSWGWGLAAFLQFTKIGQLWAEERTWLTVIIGVGIDMAISYRGDWWTVMGVITASSIGILARSWYNERQDTEVPRLPNKTQWSLDEATSLVLKLIDLLTLTLSETQATNLAAGVSAALGIAHKLPEKIRDARLGQWHNGKEK